MTVMTPSFLQRYLDAFHRIDGWILLSIRLCCSSLTLSSTPPTASRAMFSRSAFFQGLSAITIAHLRGPGRRA